MKLLLGSKCRAWTPLGALFALVLFLLFVAGLLYLAYQVIQALQRLFPPPPPDDPNGLVRWTSPPISWYTNPALLAWTYTPTNLPAIEGQAQTYTVSRSVDLADWQDVLRVTCWPEDIAGFLNELLCDEAARWPTNCAFYKAEPFSDPSQ